MYDRRLRDIVRYADGEKIHDFHIPTDARRLPRRLPRLPARPRPPGRPRPLGLRQHVGQPRVLLARLPGHRRSSARTRSGARPARSPPTRPGSNTSRRASKPGGHPGALRRARRSSTRRSPHFDDARPRPGAQQPRRHRQPDRLPRPAVRPPRRAHPHRPAQLPLGGPVRPRRRPTPFGARRTSPSSCPRRCTEILDAGRAYNGGQPPATIRMGDKDDRQLPQGRARR